MLDESGLGQTGVDEAFVFAGFLGAVTQWENLVHQFDRLLNQPPILRESGFKKLLRRKRNSPRVHKFVDALGESGIYRVECRIPKDAYEKAILSQLPKWHGKGITDDDIWRLKNEYYIGFFTTITSILLPMKLTAQPTTKLEVIYDLNINEVAKLKAGYKDFVEIMPEEANRLFAEPHGETGDDFMPILAADLLAWHIHRDFVETSNGRKHKDSVWDALRELPKYPEPPWNEETLREMAQWDRLAELVAQERR